MKKENKIKPDIIRDKGRTVAIADHQIELCLETPNAWNYLKNTKRTYAENLVLMNTIVERYKKADKFKDLNRVIETDYNQFKFRIKL